MFRTEKKSIASCLLVLTLLCFTFYNLTLKNHAKKPRVLFRQDIKDDTSCHEKTEGDALPSAEDASFSPPADSIFFHETSCRGALTSRQACAVESAAKAHPERKINVLFSGPISHHTLNSTGTSFFALKNYPNIDFARVHAKAYSKNTPLENVFCNEEMRYSPWKLTHTSDLLRVITMFKFGGIYLDTDVIVLKAMDALGTNWVVRESNAVVNLAVMSVAKDELGRGLMEKILMEIYNTYSPDERNLNGPEAATRVLFAFCNASHVNEFSNETCRGFKVYGPEVVYPVPHHSHKKLFKAGDMPALDGAYSVHLWNYLTYNLALELDSPVETLAYQYCPVIYELYEDSFGY